MDTQTKKEKMDIIEFDTSRAKRTYLDVQYGTLDQQKLDIYLPDEGEGPFPLVIYVHGGGWILGTKRQCALDVIFDVLKSGCAIMAPDYRLAPEVQFPEFIYDVKTAIRFARANASKYGFDPEKFILVGDSAGGHIVLNVAYTNDRPEYEGEKYGWEGVSSRVQAVVDMYGLSDLTGKDEAWFAENGIKGINFCPGGGDIYEYAFGTANPGLREVISPINLVHRDIPPTFLQHGLADTLVPVQHSTTLAERIEKVCGADRYRMTLYEGRGHADPAFKNPENCEEFLSFLRDFHVL